MKKPPLWRISIRLVPLAVSAAYLATKHFFKPATPSGLATSGGKEMSVRIDVYSRLQGEPKGDWKKGLLAAMIQDATTMRLDWISAKLRMGARAGGCRAAKRAREKWRSDRKMAAARRGRMSILNG